MRWLLEVIGSGKLASGVAAVGSAADASIDRAAGRTEALVDRIAICAAILIGLFFVALLGYRSIVKKISVT